MKAKFKRKFHIVDESREQRTTGIAYVSMKNIARNFASVLSAGRDAEREKKKGKWTTIQQVDIREWQTNRLYVPLGEESKSKKSDE